MPTDIDLSLLAPILEKYRGQGDTLITILQEIQEVYGYLPEDILTRLNWETKIPMNRIYEVVTFYAQLYMTPRGRNTIWVCRDTACHVRGDPRILEAVERELGITEGGDHT